jgi:hypothetical protein
LPAGLDRQDGALGGERALRDDPVEGVVNSLAHFEFEAMVLTWFLSAAVRQDRGVRCGALVLGGAAMMSWFDTPRGLAVVITITAVVSSALGFSIGREAARRQWPQQIIITILPPPK